MLNQDQNIFFILPGWGNSEPDHWQSLWQEKLHPCLRPEMPNWDLPDRKSWVETLEQSVKNHRTKNIIFIAHSLGCILVQFWAQKYQTDSVKCALLVAPPDIDHIYEKYPEVASFKNVPEQRLPFPSMLISSSNDKFTSMERARYLAEKWGSQHVNIGESGHINKDSNLGIWNQGLGFLDTLMSTKV